MRLNTVGLTHCVPLICEMHLQDKTSKGAGQQVQLLATPQGRQQLVSAALDFVAGTALIPSEYERILLKQFVDGSLTIEQVLEHLEAAKGLHHA
jgi:hypothetical protein